jgi:RNA polymerase sigma-70 factor (ECF subfamily)
MSPKKGAEPRGGADETAALLDGFVRPHGRPLARFFMRRVKNTSDVSDLVQDVFLRLARLGDLSAVRNPEQYLFATAASALRDQQRRDRARGGDKHASFEEFLHGRSDFTPDRVLASRQAVERLQAAIRELPERTRDVLVLRLFEEMKMAEIARVIGVSQRAVEKHYARGMAHLAERLEGYR